MRPDPTFLLTLPDGSTARCWRHERGAIQRDIELAGSVMLVQDGKTGVYRRVDPASIEGQALAPTARRV